MHLNCINETHTHRKLHFNKKLTFNSGSAIRCYECNSYNDTRCAHDIPPKDLSIECGDHQKGVKYSFCRKIKQVIEFSVNQCEFMDNKFSFCKFCEIFQFLQYQRIHVSFVDAAGMIPPTRTSVINGLDLVVARKCAHVIKTIAMVRRH